MKAGGVVLIAGLALGCASSSAPTADAGDARAPTIDAAGGCAPGVTRACFDGADATRGVGSCRDGVEVCAPDGRWTGRCVGSVRASEERCGNHLDDDCDRAVDDGCDACEPGRRRPCYSGASDTIDVGACAVGHQVCGPSGAWPTACDDEVTAATTELCRNGLDDDCDGSTDEGCEDCGDRCPAARTVSGANTHGCALMADRSVWCWGDGNLGALGGTSPAVRATPTPARAIRGVVEVVTGNGFTCARDEGGAAWCWGRNSDGQVGDGSQRTRLTPVRLRTFDLSGELTRRVQQISAGYEHACALWGDGEVWCWGRNTSGMLGTDEGALQSSPHRAPLAWRAQSIGAGTYHTCAIEVGGQVWCWGNDSFGELGLGRGSGDGSATPRRVSLPAPAEEVSGGAGFSCARLRGGQVWCWGWNNLGQLGTPRTGDVLGPVQVTGVVDAVQVVTGQRHACARDGSGRVWCWGANEDGDLGDPMAREAVRRAPVRVALSDIRWISAGHRFTCATTGDGGIWCWGLNIAGRVGVEGDGPVRTPRPLAW